jgi:hypothetical protein
MIYVAIFGLIVVIGMSFVSDKPVTPNMDAVDNCSMTNTSFKDGERLVYKIYYNWKFLWIPAGEVTMEVQEGVNDFSVVVLGTTYESYDNFFRVRDYFKTKLDKNTLLPLTFVRNVEEGDYRKFDSINFNQNSGLTTVYHGNSRATAERSTHQIDHCMHDLVSVLYSLRNTNTSQYLKNDFVKTKIFFDKELYPITVRYLGAENKKEVKGLGKFNTLKILPDLVSGNVFKDGNKMNVWVSNDLNKVPLLIESPLYIGSGKAVLKSYENLRHPLTSQVSK